MLWLPERLNASTIGEESFDCFFTLEFLKILIWCIIAGIAAHTAFGGDWSGTSGAYAYVSVRGVWSRTFRYALWGQRRFIKSYVLMGGAIGSLGGLLQLAPAGFCITSHCWVNNMHFNTLVLLVVTCVVGPIAETLLFYGGIQTAITRITGNALIAFVGSALFFVAAHGAFTPYFIGMGLVFSLLRYRGFPLIALIATHSAANAVTFALAAH